MCLLDKFCCCLLRTGAYVIAGLSIFIAVLNITVSAFILQSYDNDLKQNGSNPGFKVVSAETPLEVYIGGFSLALAVILIIASILLIVGAAKRMRKLLLPWVVMAVLNCLLNTADIVIAIVIIALGKGRPLGSIFMSVAEILILVYCSSAVMSLYKNDCYEIGESRQEGNVIRYDPVTNEVYNV